MDAPVSAAAEGMLYFQDRITDEMRQKYRDLLFKATADDVRNVASKYLLPHISNASVAVIAGHGTAKPEGQTWEERKFK